MTDVQKILRKTKVDDALSILLRYIEDGRSRTVARKTLADLRRLDTNAELKRLMAEKSLSLRDVADMTMVSYDTVASWTVKRGSARWRRMPNRNLALLKLTLRK